jgi:hypothetical protein
MLGKWRDLSVNLDNSFGTISVNFDKLINLV